MRDWAEIKPENNTKLRTNASRSSMVEVFMGMSESCKIRIRGGRCRFAPHLFWKVGGIEFDCARFETACLQVNSAFLTNLLTSHHKILLLSLPAMKLLFVLSCVLLSLTVSAQSMFGPNQDLSPYSIKPNDLYSVDFDLDGDLDLMVSSYVDNEISWYENTGTDEYWPQHIITRIAQGVRSCFPKDLDGDGDVDVVFAEYSADAISWCANNGVGEFQEKEVITTEVELPRHASAADLNNDGFMEVVSASTWDDDVAFYTNNGDGTFGPKTLIDGTFNGAWRVELADINEDGNIDVLAASSSNGVSWYENLGGLEFSEEIPVYSGNSLCKDAVPVDLDLDSHLDVLTCSSANGEVVFLQNMGDASFASETALPTILDDPSSLHTADLTGNEYPDILVADADLGQIMWFENFGEFSFGEAQVLTNEAVEAESVYAADLNGDGLNDVVFTSSTEHIVGWFKQLPDGSFSSLLYISVGGSLPTFVHAADVNQDGLQDVVASFLYNEKIVWFENLGGGNLSSERIVSDDAYGAKCLDALDVNNDGFVDIISANQWDDKLVWYANDGAGNFSVEHVISSVDERPIRVLTSDLNGNGFEDLLFISTSINGWSRQLAYYPNNGDGTFGERLTLFNGSELRDMDVADFDGDGSLDVVAVNAHYQTIRWFPNDGMGGFPSFNTAAANINVCYAVGTGDFNEDGLPDILSMASDDFTIFWLENLGDDTFSAPHILSTVAQRGRGVQVADLNNDGHLDVLSASELDSKIAWYEGDGNGGFSTQRVIFDQAYNAEEVAVGDLTGDGMLDVLSVSHNDSRIAWFENKIGQGCTQTEACNYCASCWIDDGSCCFDACGCTDSKAINFNDEATCDDGSCEYAVNGYVFQDFDEDGNFDLADHGLPNQKVEVPDLGITLLTNDDGYFETVLPEGSHVIQSPSTESFPTHTGFAVTEVQGTSTLNTAEFGFTNEDPLAGLEVNFYQQNGGFLCDEVLYYHVSFRNTGNQPLNGFVRVQHDPLFQDYVEVTPSESYASGIITLPFEALQPRTQLVYAIGLLSPTAAFMGETVESIATVEGYIDGELVAQGEKALSNTVSCGANPEDKRVFPEGYTDDHLTLNDQELEFLVQFQNNGDNAVNEVEVRDVVTELMDLSSFALQAHSHSVITTIYEDTREVVFTFKNIDLPSSATDPEGSKGFVTFSLDMMPDLEEGTVINNTALVYFDQTFETLTHTTTNTIHACAEALDLSFTEVVDCPGNALEVTSNYNTSIDWPTSYMWTHGEITMGQSDSLILSPLVVLTEPLVLTVTNPLCAEQGQVTAVPDLEFAWTTCPGDINCDGDVDASDVLTFLGEFACDGVLCTYDLDADGIVDSSDLLVVIGAFGVNCE